MQSDFRYEFLLDAAADAIVIADAETGLIIQVNEKALELTGSSYKDLIGNHILTLHPKDQKKIIVKDFAEIVKGNKRITQTEILHKSGKRIPVEINPSHFTDENGQKLIIGYFRDLTQRVKWQKALADSELKYDVLFETVKEGILFLDPEAGRFKYVNPAMCEFLGYSKDSFLKMGTKDIHPQIGYDVIRNNFIKALEGKISTIQDVPCLTKMGKTVYANVSVTYITLDENRYIAAFFNDTTERRIAEQKQRKINKDLEESEVRYRKLVESSPNIILVIQENTFLFANSMALKTSGYKSMEDLQKISAIDLIHPDDRGVLVERFEREKKGFKNESIELRVLTKSGSSVLVESISMPIVYNEKPASLIICTDITERRRVEYAAIETENTIKEIQKGLASKLGEKFFETIVIKLARILKANYAFVGEIGKNSHSSIETISFYNNGRIGKNFQYTTEETPCERVMQQGICVYNEKVTEIFPKDDLLITMEIEGYVGVPLYDSKGSAVGIMVALFKKPISSPEFAKTILDIFSARAGAEIERMLAERKLEKANKSFRTIAENLPDVLLRVNTDFKCTYVSPNVFAYTAIKAEDYLGKRLNQVGLTPDFSRNRELDFKKVLETKESFQSILSVKTEKGYRTFEWRMLPEFDEKGKVESILNMVRDLTETRSTETQLNQLFSLSVDLLCIVNKNGPFVKVNPAWEIIMGYSQQELMEIPFFDLIHPDDLINTYQIIADRLEKNALVYNFENRYRCKDGSYKWLSWVTQPFGNDDLMFAIARDITDQKIMVSELINAKEKAEESDTLKSAFLANMSHEIRTPMNAIIGFASLLRRDDIKADKRKYYSGIIQNRSEDLLSIINDILDISKIESKQIQLVIEEFSINEILFELLEDFRQKLDSLPSKDIELKIGKRADLTFDRIKNDRLRIKQVLTNLIDNAIKFTDKGKVVFGCVFHSNYIQFYVSDTGIGISKEMQSQIFDRFRQAEDSMTRKYGGNGLGLSISRALVEMMGGEIWLDSIENTGTSFYFNIPVAAKNRGKQSIQTQKIGEGIDLAGKKILIVEDEVLSREYLSIVLKQVGGEVFIAGSGTEALDIFKGNIKFDLVLMDIHLPDIDGYKVTRSIRKIDPEIPIIAQTAFAMSEDKIKCMQAGCTGYLSKPIKSDDLLEAIQRAFSSD